MGAPTAKLETVVVASPIKTMSYLFNIIAFIVAFCATLSTFWIIEDKDTRYGLWHKCEIYNGTAQEQADNDLLNDQHLTCEVFNRVWTQLCGALVAVATVCAGFGVALTFFGFNHQKRQDRKMKFYRSALFVHFVGILCLVLALTIFPLYFVNELSDENESDWYFGWSYGAGWGAVIFLVGASILLICDRNREEIFYKETLYLNEDEENANAPEEQKE